MLDSLDSIQDGYHWDWYRCSFKDTNQKSELANQNGLYSRRVFDKIPSLSCGRIVQVNNVKTNGKMDRGL